MLLVDLASCGRILEQDILSFFIQIKSIYFKVTAGGLYRGGERAPVQGVQALYGGGAGGPCTGTSPHGQTDTHD